MNSKKIWATLAAIACSVVVSAQWTIHISLDVCTYAANATCGQIAGNDIGFVMHYNDGSVIIFSKSNHLSDIGISTVVANGNTAYVGYSNGNIDIIDLESLTTTNIPELKNYTAIDSKAINHFYKYGQTLYCSTTCGIIAINLNKNEIVARYPITNHDIPIVNCLTIYNDTIYAGTTNGLYCANAKNNILENAEEWKQHATLKDNISDIAIFNNKILVANGKKGGTNKIYIANNNDTIKLWNIEQYRNISATKDILLITNNNSISKYNKELTQTEIINNLNINGNDITLNSHNAQLSENGTIAIADRACGLIVVRADGYADRYTSKGPVDNYSYSLYATNNGVYCSKGGANPTNYNNLNRAIGVSLYRNNTWINSWGGARDALFFAADPNCADSVYVSTWGKGIYKVENGQLTTHYTAENSTLTDIFGGKDYTRASSICYNQRSTLFVWHAESDYAIAIKSPDGEWGHISYPMTDKLHSTQKLIFTSNDNGWLIIARNQYRGIFVFNTNGTDFDDSDDIFRGTASFADSRCYDKLQLWNADGEVITNGISDIVEDRDNVLWFATDVGVVTFSGDKDIFSTPKPIFEQVKVPRNDGTDLADYLLDGVKTTAIAVDGANRKWIGTNNNGVLLVNADGSEILEQFTTNNSPLPSDEISSIAIDPKTGEVFFATSLGLVSYRGNAIAPAEKLSNIKIYPNPVTPQNNEVRITGFTDNSRIKITDVNGRLLSSTKSIGGMATWNCTNLDGSRVSTGVYIVWATNADGTEKAVGKILVVK